MSKILIIAEKPSVATDLARVLGKELGKFTKDKNGSYFESDQAVITSAVGHLLEQKKPQTAEGKSLPWKFACLPVIPKTFELEPIKQSEDRLKKVMQLAKRKDIGEIVNACDAGREGELIFRNMVRYGKWDKKKMSRLWMQSMTDDSILSSWHALRSEEDMAALADAAICRSESDWLIGLNSTRALTVLQSRGGFNITPAGRVQTPTLAILTQRELEIQAFVPSEYSEVVAEFGVKAGIYSGKWFDTAWKKNENVHARAERIWDKQLAEDIRTRCEGKIGTVTEEKKPATVIAPLLYDLTSLQRDAANRYGFSARRTLQLAQECYEKHKVLTYPRTDSRYLPDDYINKVNETMGAIVKDENDFSPFAKEILDKNRVKPNKRIFDVSKVSDHFAIVPTGKLIAIPGDAQKLFDMVMARFLAVFFPPAVFEDTKRTTLIEHTDGIKDHFSTTGRILVEPGWQAVYGRRPGSGSKDDLVPVDQGEMAHVKEIAVKNSMTKPPARFNEATLLGAMEGAGKLVDDDELRAAMSERGLGTPATRASIIEGLISQEYIARDGRELVATRKGIELVCLLQKIGLETLTSPSMTGEWEYKLKQMEQGKLQRGSFMSGIEEMTIALVENIKAFQMQMQQVELTEFAIACPQCGAQGLKNTQDAVSCRSCKFSIRKTISGRELTDEEMTQLILEKKMPILTGFTSRFGKPFDAGLLLDEKFHAKFYFPEKPEDPDKEKEVPVSIGMIPAHDGKQYDLQQTSDRWKLPELHLGKSSNGLSISRIILSREITQEEVNSIVLTGKTPLLKGFISQRTKRPFDAYLVLNFKTGKIGFEFDKTERKPTRKTTSKTTAKKEEAPQEAVKVVKAVKKKAPAKKKPTKAKE
ncbi:MAG: DNA topoisomerase 3 [Akkermansia sp.]